MSDSSISLPFYRCHFDINQWSSCRKICHNSTIAANSSTGYAASQAARSTAVFVRGLGVRSQ